MNHGVDDEAGGLMTTIIKDYKEDQNLYNNGSHNNMRETSLIAHVSRFD